MTAWSEPQFLEQAGEVGRSAFARAHTDLLAALRRAGAVPTFDGTGKKQATYKVRPAEAEHWHILRVNANGEVILMLNHLRESHSPSTAKAAEELFEKHLRSKTGEAPRLSRDATEFLTMDFEAIAGAVRKVRDIVRG